MKTIRPRRGGYALLLALVFVVMTTALYGTAFRQSASAIRIQEAQTLQRLRDEGSIPAIARALALLETGIPPVSPYVCGLTMNTSSGSRSYRITFVLEGKGQWKVVCTPTTSTFGLLPLPLKFGL